jgi:PAS domain S-box-containing protein
VVLDRQGRVELANSAFEKLFQYDQNELASFDIRDMGISDDKARDSGQLILQIFAGNTLQRTVRQWRKDGQILDLALHGVPLLQDNEVGKGTGTLHKTDDLIE